jgi:C-terminal processing protease CtpA/Prc
MSLEIYHLISKPPPGELIEFNHETPKGIINDGHQSEMGSCGMKRMLFLFSILLLLINNQKAQVFYPRQALLDEIDSLCVMIRDIHPNMFAYLTPEAFEQEVMRADHLVGDSMTRLDFCRIVLPLIARLGDGHTAVYFPYDELDKPSVRLFPVRLEVNYRDSSAISTVIDGVPENIIPPGSRILSINGRDMKHIIGEMLEYVSGEKTYYRASRINKRFAPLFFLLYGDSVFNAEYMHADTVSRITINGVSYADIKESGLQSQFGEPDRAFSLDSGQAIAMVRFNRFEDFSGLRSYIDSVFTIINETKVEDLIIDIRTNGGGDSRVVDELFQYISPVPFSQVGELTERRSARLRSYLEDHFGFTFEDTDTVKHFAGPPLNLLRPNPLRFSGKTWLLTSHFTFSAAADLAWAFRYFGMGTVIGEETGGLAVSFGAVIPQKLPITGIEFGVSTKHFYNYGATDDNRHGAIPDYKVPKEDAMRFAVDLILKTRD